ncbi:MAG: WXG100 family type VII secretion target [Ruminococcus sp.]|nr:WXG100 family type VII secretion target [Ruminococcus sp.]
MAWGDPKSLKFDVEEISSMRTKLQDTATELKDLKVRLLQELETLKSKWKTPAADTFTKGVDNDWAKQVDKYVTIVEAVDELLAVAEKEYREVEEKANSISF